MGGRRPSYDELQAENAALRERVAVLEGQSPRPGSNRTPLRTKCPKREPVVPASGRPAGGSPGGRVSRRQSSPESRSLESATDELRFTQMNGLEPIRIRVHPCLSVASHSVSFPLAGVRVTSVADGRAERPSVAFLRSDPGTHCRTSLYRSDSGTCTAVRPQQSQARVPRLMFQVM